MSLPVLALCPALLFFQQRAAALGCLSAGHADFVMGGHVSADCSQIS